MRVEVGVGMGAGAGVGMRAGAAVGVVMRVTMVVVAAAAVVIVAVVVVMAVVIMMVVAVGVPELRVRQMAGGPADSVNSSRLLKKKLQKCSRLATWAWVLSARMVLERWCVGKIISLF